MNVALIKYSEIWLKGKNRILFENQLIKNIASALSLRVNDVCRMHSRIYVENPKDASKLKHVFGVHAYTLAEKVSDDIDEIKEVAVKRMKAKITNEVTFAVSSRKEGGYKMGSVEINTEVGASIGEAFPDMKVNLSNPDITLFVEVREGYAFIYTSIDEEKGRGGLPVGVIGSALSLISGGMDSPVASVLGMKRGLVVDGIYFHSAPYTSKHAEEKVLDIARVLAQYNRGSMGIFVPPFGEVQKYITENAAEEYWTILFRRSMRRIAEMIALEKKYQLLISGDNLAQVASQTPENIRAVEEGMDVLMIRPVIGYDKQEIIDLAQKIGTYDISARPFEDCCSVFTPRAPKTKARIKDVVYIEKKLADLDRYERECFGKIKVYKVEPGFVEEI